MIRISLVVCVYEDVKAEQIKVVVEASNALLDHAVDVLVAAEDCLDHNIFHSTPERFWVFTSFSQPSP